MIFEPLGLLGLLAVPAILAVHLFRQRFPPRPVTALFLFGPRRQVVAAGRRRERILSRTSLWLELAAALALTWWLCDPHWSPRGAAPHLVAVLDDRWRMQAVGTDGRSAAERARAAVLRRIDDLGASARVTLIASGAPPRLLAGPAADAAAARTALAAWRPQAAWHGLDDGLALGASLGGAGAHLMAVSDRDLAGLPEGCGLEAVGEPLATSGLAEVRWQRDTQGDRLAVRVYRHGAQAMARPLAVRRGGAVLAEARPAPPADGEATAVMPLPGNLPEGAEIEIALTGPDPLAIDDGVRLVRPAPRTVRVRIDLPRASADAVRRALAVCPAVDLAAGAADLAIGGSAAPASGCWWVRLAPGAAKPALGPFLARRGHPLMADLDCTGVLWSGGAPAAAAGADVLLAAGATVLAAEERRGRDRVWWLHCDPATSTLDRHPSWPSLWWNAIEARRALLPGLPRSAMPLGQPLSAVLPPGAAEVALVAPDGTQRSLIADADGAVAIAGLDQPGEYRLAIGGTPWAVLRGLPLDPRQGDLAASARLSRPPAPTGASDVERRRGPLAHLLPLVMAALAALAAWVAFRREE